MRIGLLDLDTSHPQNWVPIERELGHEVVGVWDGGDVHPAGYAQGFADEHNIPRVFESPEAMVDEVDCVVVHGCNWDKHVERARPFAEAGKSVLVDKPMAGCLGDLALLRAWDGSGVRITGGSSLRPCCETQQWLAQPVEERGTPQTVFCGCGVDEFNYGIHAYSLLAGIMGPGAEAVRCLPGNGQRRVQITWAGGRVGYVAVGEAESWLPFHATIVTEKAVVQYQPDSSRLYRGLLEEALPYLAGEVDTPAVPMDVLVEVELCALAARRSWHEDFREVRLDELDGDDPGYDGSAFAESYRRTRYPA